MAKEKFWRVYKLVPKGTNPKALKNAKQHDGTNWVEVLYSPDPIDITNLLSRARRAGSVLVEEPNGRLTVIASTEPVG